MVVEEPAKWSLGALLSIAPAVVGNLLPRCGFFQPSSRFVGQASKASLAGHFAAGIARAGTEAQTLHCMCAYDIEGSSERPCALFFLSVARFCLLFSFVSVVSISF